jgi:putative tricarboxylic transport membrane protein
MTPRLLALTLAFAGLAPVSSTAQPVLDSLTIVAPAAPGGGWDQLARELEREIESHGLATIVQVENVPGAAGTIGLAQFINDRRGDGRALLVNGLVMLGAILWNESPVSITQVTPIARLTGEYEVVAVPAASPHHDMQSLVGAVRENPAAVSWGGGSAGGTDHILAGLIVAAAGIDPRRTNYIAFSGGGEAVTALLGGQVTAGISGYSEFAQHVESGRLRLLGVSAPGRLTPAAGPQSLAALADVPTLIEQGLDVELENWRAVVAPPGLTDDQRQALIAMLDRLAGSESWRATLARLGWTDSYLTGAPFAEFLDAERVRVGRIVARLRGSPGSPEARQVGEWIFPAFVFGGAVIVLIALVSRRSAAVQPVHIAGVIRILAGLALFVGLLNSVGFVAAGAALFVTTSSAFGSRRWLRDALVGFALCTAVYLTFTYALGVPLP